MANNKRKSSHNVVSLDEFSERNKPVHSVKPTNRLKLRIDDLNTFDALTENQEKFFKIYNSGTEVIGMTGSPGVGKTFLALYKALEEVMDKSNHFETVIIVRSAVQVRDQGYVPGTLEEKQEIYEMPYHQICHTLFERDDAYDRLKEQGFIKFMTTTAIRGISLDNCIIVVDEMQSMNFHELSSVITRPGQRSKIIFCGDFKQSDLLKSKHDVSGMPNFIKVLSLMKEYDSVEFTSDDIVRNSLVKSFIKACEKLGL